MTKRGLLVGALVAVVALGSGCFASKETRESAKELRDRLDTPSWASSVTVETGLDGRFEDFVQVTVRLDGSATVDDVAGFVEALPDVAEDAGVEGPPGLALVAAAGAKLDVAWGADVVDAEVRRGLTEWLGVADALGAAVAATAQTDGGASYVVTLGDAPRSAVHDAYDTVASLTEPDTAWQVTSTSTSTSAPLSMELSVAAPPTADQLRVWDALVGSLDLLPAELSPSLLSLHLLDRTVADLGLLAPAGTTGESFTVAAWGRRVWPAVHPELAALHGLPDAWTYGATVAAADTTWDENLFISLLSDQEPNDNGDETTRWSQAAAEYVHGL